MAQLVSVQECAATDLSALLTAAGNLPTYGVVGGPPTDDAAKGGVVSVVYTGPLNPNLYVDVIDARIQIRVLHRRLATAEQIAQTVMAAWHQVGRRTVLQASNGHTYLVHLSNLVAGFSQHYDTQETWEYLGFAQFMIGTDAVT